MSGGKTIVDAVKDHYNGGGGLKRFNDYFTNRWGNATDCKASAHNALTAAALAAIAKVRARVRRHVWSLLHPRPGGFPWLTVAGGLKARSSLKRVRFCG
ncbi:hypothetical protein [Streptomyces sp. NPDC001508]|uniref:hypothetical protein n=1 Tax=Streptomyces sp. NPDC001508 TaxID=3154656 RepID=UPI003318F864